MRSSTLVTLTALVLSATLAACGSSPDDCEGGSCGGGGAGGKAACGAEPKAGEIPCDVFAVLQNNCHSCHSDPPKNGAPFPLLTYADTQAPYGSTKLVYQQMFDQIQPGAAPRMPLGGALSAADQKTLEDWLSACAPSAAAGQGCD